MRQSTNMCWVEGILNTVNLREVTYQKNGQNVEAIAGDFTVLVEREIDGIPSENIIPFGFFVNKYMKNGNEIAASYKSLIKLQKEYVSIAASSREQADRVRISSRCEIGERNFLGRDGNPVHINEIRAQYVDKVRDKFEPQANFWVDLYLIQVSDVLDNDGIPVEPARAKVKGVLIGYNDRVEVVEMVANSAGVISTLKGLELNHVYKLKGMMDFSTSEISAVEVPSEGGFGDDSAPQRKRTVSKKDFVITGGNTIPLEDEFTPTEQEMGEALTRRKASIDADFEKQRQRKKARENSAPTSGRPSTFANLGF